MGLSNDLISQFVKVTRDTDKSDKERTVYGTIVEYNGSKYVKLDGSDLLTPLTSTTNVEPDERVTVMIKNHSAIVTGNMSSPAARTEEVEVVGSKISEFEIIIADKVDVKELNTTNGRIDNLQADNVIIKDSLSAREAEIKNLQADNVTIKDNLTANSADIVDLKAKDVEIDGKLTAKDAVIDSLQADNVIVKNQLSAAEADITTLKAHNVTIDGTLAAHKANIDDLEAKKLSAEEAEITYANIDFSNIGKAAMEYLYANSGLIKDVIIENGTITGNLIGVTISGDLIEGNTIVAEKLVIKGEDGLYYQLNTDGVTTEAEQTDYNSLNGSIIMANSITATKIDVSDLVAFDATIGGFKITENSIYSGVKETVDNATRGIYLDNDGQFNFGNSANYVKFYKDADGIYRLGIAAESITLGSSGKNVEEAITEAYEAAIEAQVDIDGLEIGGTNLFAISKSVDGWIDYTGTLVEESRPDYEAGYRASDYISVKPEDVLIFQEWAPTSGTLWRGVSYFNSDREYISVTDSTYSYESDYVLATYNVPDGASYARISCSWTEDMRVKLEIGNKPTAWSMSPDDVNGAIRDAQTLADSNTVRLNDARIDIDSLRATISMLVTGQNGESLMTQTENGWTFSISNIQKSLDDAVNNVSVLTSDITSAKSTIDILQDTVTDLGVYTDYINFGTEDGKPCIILGENDSPFKVIITNTDIRFMEGTNTPASISNQSLIIEKAVIESELRQGEFVWMARENGNYGILWKGVE